MEKQQEFSPLHRILHWVMAMAMPLLFITGFLRMYWMSKDSIVSVIQSKTETTPLSKEQMVSIAKNIREPMWQWHEWIAYIMIIAFVIRIGYMLVKGIRFPNPFKENTSSKERLQGLTYVYFYLFVFVSAFTGICIEKGFLEQRKEDIESVHKWGIYLFPIFIVLHLFGLIIAEHSIKKGIVSKMIGGD
nr:cytochrome b/b6 domain-containing protein [uncultured Pedobacter sp.]